jgi:uncharacterized RDD family membrane protein YckC
MAYVPSPAGFWKRYVAYFIDIVLLTVVLNLVMTPLMLVLGLAMPVDEAAMRAAIAAPDVQTIVENLGVVFGPWLLITTALSLVLYVLIAGVYFVWMEAAPHQASLGKRLMRLRVTDHAGQPITRARAFGRFAAASLSWLTLNVGHALAAWTPERRALHDYLAGTRVENADPANTAMPGWGWAIIALNAVVFLGIAFVGVVSGVLLMQMQMQY